MKGLSIKKLAAIATGAALVGSALAPIVSAQDVTKGDIYNDNGTPKVNIVVGSNAQISDVIWAGNVASKIAEKATRTVDVTASGEIGAAACSATLGDLTVDLTVGGTTTVSTEQQKLYKTGLKSNTTVEVSAQSLTKTSLPFLKDETVTIKVDGNTSSINEQEKIYVNADAKGWFTSSPRDLITMVKPSRFYYQVTLNSTTGIDLGTTSFTDSGGDDSIPIWFFGEKYFLNNATLTGTKEVRLVKSSQKDKYYRDEVIEGLKGDGEYDGQEVSVKISSIVLESGTGSYKATFELIVDGDVVYSSDALGSGEDLKDSMYDSSDNAALKDSVYVDSVGLEQETSQGYVLVTVGANTIKLVNAREYPYDSTSTSSDPDYWKTTIDVSGNYLKSLKIENDDTYWDRSTTPLYPTTSGQSLTGQTGARADFGEDLPEGTVGKGFAKIEFKGFDYSGKTITTVEIGKEVSDAWASEADHGGIRFLGYDDTTRYVPFYTKVVLGGIDARDQNTTFTAYSGTTAKTIYATLNKGTSADASNRADHNVTVYTGDYVNGRLWTIAKMTAGTVADHNATLTVTGVGRINPYGYPSIADVNVGVGDSFAIDGVTYTISDANFADSSIHVYVDGYLTLGQTDYVGQSGGSSIDTFATDTNHEKWYFTEGVVYDSNVALNNVDLDVDSTRRVYNVFKVTTDEVYLLLADQDFDQGESSVIQSSKKLRFVGTSIPPDDGTYTETATSLRNGTPYYSPKDEDFNVAAANTSANGVYTSGKAYFTAQFKFNDTLSGPADANVNVLIDTADGGLPGPFTNDNMAWPTFDANFENGLPAFYLTTGTSTNYYTKAYVDTGTKVVLDEDNDSVKITSPDTNANIQIVVYGAELVETTTGGESKTGIAEGDTWTTDTGTEIKVDAISSDCSCEATEEGNGGTCVPSITSCVSAASVSNPIVYLDTDSPAGANIIIGGHLVNDLAAQIAGLADRLTSPASEPILEVDSATGDIIAAGYTADQTGLAAQELIDLVDGFA